eukprot:gnl/MRDRNA2_/MRDRNA2_47251_c0_seq1.p1 gnl/MRDRNA2_/MRDRNA2_47251_c0~~gnl/MRDRNA2_/MRDRNA2_47251_c0_seq1.p1  ORF type:complete len:326 (-),score=74.78 gnl/MRDRNA2_/MRDRNA2_47251_c0_seq1:65-1042(-)
MRVVALIIIRCLHEVSCLAAIDEDDGPKGRRYRREMKKIYKKKKEGEMSLVNPHTPEGKKMSKQGWRTFAPDEVTIHPDMEGKWMHEEEAKRYWRTASHPDDKDRVYSSQMGFDMRCDACKLILKNVVKRAKSFEEDALLDVLEGVAPDYELPKLQGNTDMEQHQKAKVKRLQYGCNKHFKDILRVGWTANNCTNASMNDEFQYFGRTWCLHRSWDKPTEADINTYCVDNESVYYACKNTIGAYSQEIAASLSEKLLNPPQGEKKKDKKARENTAVVNACLNAAKCKTFKGSKKEKDKQKKKHDRPAGMGVPKHAKKDDEDDEEL